MASEDLEISLHLDIDRLQQTFMEKDFADAFLFDALTSVLFGQIRVSCSGHERAAIDNERLLVNLKRVWKRKSTSPQNGPPGRKTMRLIEPIARKDVQTALKDLNLMPDIGADLGTFPLYI